MKVAVSACLLGENCKYNGKNNYNERIIEYLKDKEVYPICPEVLGGLSTPRDPAEIKDGVVMTKSGVSVDKEYHRGAELALKVLLDNHVEVAILQSRSPSCGVNQIYDGNFTKKLIDGAGVTAKLLKENGIKTIDSDSFQ